MYFISSSFGSSVMAKLPATSYVRMVDIWLIFTQLYPFLEVVLYTIIELYNEEEVTNHHGFKKDIPEEQRHVVHVHHVFSTSYYIFLIIYVYLLFSEKSHHSLASPSGHKPLQNK